MTESPFQARAREEAAEYSTYRAVANIFFEGALAYRPGHAVPVSNVRLHGYDRDGLVERVDGQPISPLPPALPTPAPESPEPVTQIDAPADEPAVPAHAAPEPEPQPAPEPAPEPAAQPEQPAPAAEPVTQIDAPA